MWHWPGRGGAAANDLLRFDEGILNSVRSVALIENQQVSFTAERREGEKFSVKLAARERDDPPFGPPNYNDLNRSNTATHTFGPTGWSNLPEDSNTPISVPVSKAASCKVELSYTVVIN